MDIALAAAHQHDAAFGELVLDRTDRDLITGALPAGEQDHISRRQFDLVVALGYARERRARLTLPAGGDDQHLAAG